MYVTSFQLLLIEGKKELKTENSTSKAKAMQTGTNL